MTMAPQNRAAWLKEPGKPLVVEPAPYWEPQENEVLVKTVALGINPFDYTMQMTGIAIKEWPAVLGCDIAGTVAAVGPGVTQFKEGDRIMASSQIALRGTAKYGTFQEYAIIPLPTAAKIPDQLTDEQVVVLPLAIDTASACLFQKGNLGLAMPPTDVGEGKSVIVWGGSTSVGMSAIQLLTAAGYDVIALASSKNFDLCRSLGAATLVDYSSQTVEGDLLAAVQGKKLEGAIMCVKQPEAIKVECRVLAKAGGVKKVASVMPGSEKHAVEGVEVTSVMATTVAVNEVGPHIWTNFLPQAMSNGSIQCKPDPLVAAHGLEGIEKAIEVRKGDIRARKIVVKL